MNQIKGVAVEKESGEGKERRKKEGRVHNGIQTSKRVTIGRIYV